MNDDRFACLKLACELYKDSSGEDIIVIAERFYNFVNEQQTNKLVMEKVSNGR
jgi:hypothetical protein